MELFLLPTGIVIANHSTFRDEKSIVRCLALPVLLHLT